MKTSGKNIIAVFLVGLIAIALVGGCRRVSEIVEDPSAGINGGFEIVSKGLPVNWIMYTPHHPEYRDKPRDERVAVQGKGRVIQEVRNGI